MLVAALALVGLIIFALRPEPVMVDVAGVGRGKLQVTVDAEGRTRVHDRFVVAAPVAGRLARITLDQGDAIRRDQVVARIDPLPLAPLDPRQLAEANARVRAAEAQQREAAAMVERVRADCNQARRERERAERLVESGDISRQEFERIRNIETTCAQELEAARFKARAAASEVEVARAALLAVGSQGRSDSVAAVMVRSPVEGRVLRVIEKSERVVAAGTPLVELSNPNNLEIVVDVLSSDAVKINPGAQVLIEDWGGAEPLEARVRVVEPSAFTKVSALGIEEQRVNVIADFLGSPGPLGDGFRVEARIVIWEGENVLKIPSSALFRQGDEWSVFVIEDGKALRRYAQVGHRSAFEVEILSGIEEGAQVILHPANEIEDGARVEARGR